MSVVDEAAKKLDAALRARTAQRKFVVEAFEEAERYISDILAGRPISEEAKDNYHDKELLTMLRVLRNLRRASVYASQQEQAHRIRVRGEDTGETNG